MKKTILLLLIVVSFSNLKAQVSDGSGGSSGSFFIGAKGGYGIVTYKSTLEGEKNFAETSYDNLSGGILLGYKLGGRLSFQLEGNYAQYGANNIIPSYVYSPQSPVLASYGSNSTVSQVDMDIYTVDVPLTIRFNIGTGTFSPYIYAGANYGFNFSAKATIIRETVLNETVHYNESTDDITDRVIYYEFAPVAGGGIMIDFIGYAFVVDARYKYGLTNLSNVDNNLGYTNRALWISAGFFIYL